MTRKALGKGLSALLREIEVAPEQPPALSTQQVAARPAPLAGLQELPVGVIDSSPFQPRANFDPIALEELARSVAAGGVVQPILVRPLADRYQVVAGERRLHCLHGSLGIRVERLPAALSAGAGHAALDHLLGLAH